MSYGMNLKKLACAAAFVLLAAGMTACGQKAADTTEPQKENVVETEEATAATQMPEPEESTETTETEAEETAAADDESGKEAVDEPAGVTLEIGETVDCGIWMQTTVYPDNIDDTFVIDVMLPEDYDESIAYPVVYLTDCYWRRENYAELQELYQSGKTKEFILIGIGYPDDYDFDTIRMRDLIEEPDKFLNMIITAVLPYAEENYHIDPADRTFAGASCGGFFMLYSLFQSDGITKDVFRNYVLASPMLTLETNGKAIKDFETKYFEKTDDLKANVYMTAGADEPLPSMLRPCQRFAKGIEERNCPSLNYTYEEYEGKEHYTVWVPSLLKGLEMFLAE